MIHVISLKEICSDTYQEFKFMLTNSWPPRRTRHRERHPQRKEGSRSFAEYTSKYQLISCAGKNGRDTVMVIGIAIADQRTDPEGPLTVVVVSTLKKREYDAE